MTTYLPNSSCVHLRMRGLYAVTPDEPDTRILVAQVGKALEGGARVVQYRNKAASSALAMEQALALRELTRGTGATLIVNDNAALALAVSADGVHLGRNDGVAGFATNYDDLRRQASATSSVGGSRFIVGMSCYNEMARADAAANAGADYLAFGSFYPSPTKPNATRAPLSLISEARQRYPLPLVAIGGITVKNAPQLISAGVDAIAVISSLFNAHDIAIRAQQFNSLFPPHV